MKKIEAIIKPFKLESVKEALTEIGISCMLCARFWAVTITSSNCAEAPLAIAVVSRPTALAISDLVCLIKCDPRLLSTRLSWCLQFVYLMRTLSA